MFVEPLIMASILLFLNYAIGISDLWLHSATRSTAATLALPNVMTSASDVELGVALSKSLCPSPGAGASAPSLDCLAHPNGWAAGDEAEKIMPASWLVLYNATTAPFRVVTLADQSNTAVIVSTIPKALGPLVTSSFFYEAPTLAVRSSCNIITGNCTQDQKGHVTDCTNAGAPFLPLKWNFTEQSRPKCDFSICFPNRIFGVIDGQIGSFTDYTIQAFDPNITLASVPMVLGMQLQLNPDKVFYENPREDVTHTVDRRDTLYATCQIEYLSGVVSYDPGTDRYVLYEENYVSPQLASVLWGPLISQYGTNRLIADILGPIMSDPSMLLPSNLIASNLARIALGLLGGVMQRTPATSVVPARQGVLGLYPVAPVFCVAGILYAYAFCAIFILFISLSSSSYTVIARPTKGTASKGNPSSTKGERALVLAQVWLTNPLPLIASVFAGKDGRDPQRSIADSSLNMVFDEEKGVDYLEIGRMKIGDEMKFGLGRRERVAPDGKGTPGTSQLQPRLLMSSTRAHLPEVDERERDGCPEIIVSNQERRIPVFRALLPNLIVVLFSTGLAIFIIFWLHKHQPQGLAGYQSGFLQTIRNGTFIVDESYQVKGRAQQAPLRGLTFSSLATHTINLTSSFLMAQVAYCVASLWLEDSRWPAQPSEDHNITPIQYGLLLGILGAPSVLSVRNALRYALRRETRRSKLPSMFIEPLIMACILLFLNYAIGISDLWLHSATRSTTATLGLPNVVTPTSEIRFGVAFNNSLCSPDSEAGVTAVTPDCLSHLNGWAAGAEAEQIMPASWLVLYNATTAPFRVVTLKDQNDTAVMVSTVPRALGPLVPSSFSYEAPTFAVRSVCKVITRDCAQNRQGQVKNCSKAGAPYLPLKWNFTDQPRPKCDFDICFPNRIFGVIDGQTGSFYNNTFQSFGPNITAQSVPLTLAMQLRLNQDEVVYHNPREGDIGAVDSRDTLYATCQVEYLDGTLSYDPGTDRYILSREIHVPPQLASVLWGPLISQYGTNRLIADILGPIMSDPTMLVPSKLIASNLARIALGLIGGVMQPTGATQVVPVRQGVLGLYPVAPVFCVAGVLYVYAFVALFILFAVVSSKSYTVIAAPAHGPAKERSPGPPSLTNQEGAVVLGQLWLTNPLPLVASIFSGKDGRDPQRSIANRSLNMVYDQEGRADYLAIGTTEIGGEVKFGLRRRGKSVRGSEETL
ncbi:hypothetical protein FRC00_006431 [Tulasnella sp. 408]|nr:hypothetical protein FRC00_006431 [Tulasnella sp. 408]